MPKLPVLSGREARKAFEKTGWTFARKKGGHMMLVKAGIQATLSIPDHRELDTGLLRGLIRDSSLTVEAFVAKL
ncbi:MAG: type II toxin-antitoxin system HicA family toxin [Fimbriimonadales bacterium]